MEVNGSREGNIRYKREITDSDMSRNDAIQKLRGMQADRDRRAHMVDELKDDLAAKLALCKQMEQEQYMAHEQIRVLED